MQHANPRPRLGLWLVAVWCLLVAGSMLWALQVSPAAQQPPLTEKQKELLKERDRSAAEYRALAKQGKLAEAIAAAEKMLALERQIFGDVHTEIDASLRILAALHKKRDD